MKKIAILLMSSALLFGACKKEDIDTKITDLADSTPAISDQQATMNMLHGTWEVTAGSFNENNESINFSDFKDPNDTFLGLTVMFNECTAGETCSGESTTEEENEEFTFVVNEEGDVITVTDMYGDTDMNIQEITSSQLVVQLASEENEDDFIELIFTK